MGRCVVYEVCEKKMVYVIRNDGGVRCVHGPASQGNVPELGDKDTIHIYDSTANDSRGPMRSHAYLVMFVERTCNRYRHIRRRWGMQYYSFPSYTMEELVSICHYFDVSPEEVRRRCLEIGPSIRYILVNDYEDCKIRIEEVARMATTSQVTDFLSNYQKHGVNMPSVIMRVAVDEQKYGENPEDAYLEANVHWDYASQALKELVEYTPSYMQSCTDA